MADQVVVRNLRKQFPKVLAVAGVDLEVRQGEVFGLLGPNGAGKTTTLEMIEGLTEPDSGEISIGGLDWRRHGPQIRARIGVQLQATSLYNKFTPREALDLFGSYYPRRRPTDELLELVQLQEKADAHHVTLSGGQAQRLALALALVNDPEVVFLDEPTAGLDPQGRRSLWEVVRGMKAAGRTVVLTTHYMEEAEALCDRVAIMDAGRIRAVDSPAGFVKGLDAPTRVTVAAGQLADERVKELAAGEAVTADEATVVFETRDPRTLLTALASDGALEGLAVRTANLEDVFLHVTGREWRA